MTPLTAFWLMLTVCIVLLAFATSPLWALIPAVIGLVLAGVSL